MPRKGEGLGNKFLAHIRETDAIAHVVRCFVNDDIVHVAGKIDPLSDIDVINTELALADLDTVERAHRRAEKDAKAGDKDAVRLRDVLKRMQDHLDAGKPARTLPLDPIAERPLLREYHLITIKPLMYVANVAEGGFENNPYLEVVRERAATEGADVVPVCAAIEAEIAQLDEGDRLAFLEELGPARAGPRPRDPRRVPPARPADVFHRGREGSARLDDARSVRSRRKRPARSTRISRRASSAPK